MNSWGCFKDKELIKQLDNEYLQVCLKVNSEYPLEDDAVKANIASLIYEHLLESSTQILFSTYPKSVYKNANKRYMRSKKRLEDSIIKGKKLTPDKMDKTLSDIEKLNAIQKKSRTNEFLLEKILKLCENSQVAYVRRNFSSLIKSLKPHFLN